MAKAKRPIIDKNLEKFINNNFDKREKKKDDSLKFEWFCNSMHIWHCSSIFFNANSKIGKEISIGTSQGGDAFFISINYNEKIYSLNDDLEEIINFLKQKPSTTITFQFIQTKYSTDANWTALLNLIDIPLKIWKGQEFDKNQPLLKKIQEFIDAITDEDDTILGQIKHKVEIYLYTKKDDNEVENLMKDWKESISNKIKDLEYYFGLGKDDDKNVRIEIRGAGFLNTVYEKLSSNEYKLLVNKNNVIESDPKKYLIGCLTAKELLDSITTTINGTRTLYSDVFKNNIRLYLGDTRVNEKIQETLNKEPEKFHFYNNGLTITTKEINDSENSKNFIISPVNIVNGCQTANSIFKVLQQSSEDDLKKVKIPVKIIVAQDKEYEDITIRTNTQNGLDEKDLISIKNIQKELEEELEKADFIERRYSYKRQKSEDNNTSSDVDFVINIDDILRASFSTLLLIPNKVSGYFDQTTLKFVDKIFDERFLKLYVIIIAISKNIEEELETNNADLVRLKHHILYLYYKFVNKNENIILIEEFFRDYEEKDIDNDLYALKDKLYSNLYASMKNRYDFIAVLNYIIDKLRTNYPQLTDLSDKTKEKILYKPVEKLKRTRVTPLFDNFTTTFNKNITEILAG